MTTKIGYRDLPLEIRQKIIVQFIETMIVDALKTAAPALDLTYVRVSVPSLLSALATYNCSLLTTVMQMQDDFNKVFWKLNLSSLFAPEECIQPLQHFHQHITKICKEINDLYRWPRCQVSAWFLGARLKRMMEQMEAKVLAQSTAEA